MDKNKRKLIEEGILAFAKEITPGGGNARIYKNIFETVSERQFEEIWESIKRNGYIPVFMDNFDQKEMIDYDAAIALGKKWGIELEQPVTFMDPDTGIVHTTPENTVVGIAEVAKQRQILIKKIGAAKHDFDVDDLTGQPIGDSKGAGISNPEIHMLLALKLPTMAKELAGVKGGDAGAYREYKNQLTTTGNTTVNSALKAGTGAKSLKTASWLLFGRHLDNTMGER